MTEDFATKRDQINHAAWVRTKMEILVIDALSDLEDVEDVATRYGLAPDTPKYLRQILSVCRNLLEKEKEDAA